ncbi:MAG: lipopolysaccharide kinase InaA family protein, partial [Granulosicoccaceae bacterium]
MNERHALPVIEHGMVMPFTIVLPEGELLECLEAVRILPGRRLVGRARWRGQDVFIKLFTGDRAERDWQREQRGSVALLTHGVSAPTLLLSTRLPEPGGFIILYEVIDDGTDAGAAYEDADAALRAMLRRQLLDTLAQLHSAGLQHTDLHLDNFLLTDDRLYVLDAGSLRLVEGAVDLPQAEDDLAVLLAQFNDLQADDVTVLYARYLEARHIADGDEARFVKTYKKARAYRERKYLDKIFRECSAFVAEHDFGRRCVFDRAYDSDCLRELLADPDVFFTDPASVMLKDGNTSTVVSGDACDQAIVIKRYNIKHAWHGLRRALRETRAATSWRNAHLLAMLGIPTAAPLAFLEERRGPLRGRSYFIMQAVAGTRAEEYFTDPDMPPELKQAQAGLLLKQFERLADAGLVHGDYKATNFVITEQGPLILDLDALRRPSSAARFRKGLARDLRRF